MVHKRGVNTQKRARFFAALANVLVGAIWIFMIFRYFDRINLFDGAGNPRILFIFAIGLTPIIPHMAIALSLWLQQRAVLQRRSAASAKGFTLCSKCEYPIDLRNADAEPVTCPECGCCFTAAEHAAIEKDWRIWKY